MGTQPSLANGWVLDADNYVGFGFIDEDTGPLHAGHGIFGLGRAFNTPGRSVVSLIFESAPDVGITGSPVPEPAACSPMAGELVAMGACVRRRRKAAA